MKKSKRVLLFSVGDTAYLRVKEHSNAARRIGVGTDGVGPDTNAEKWVIPAVVKKMGRKYITVQLGMYNYQFDKETGTQNAGDDSPNYELFGTKEEALEDVRVSILTRRLRARFSQHAASEIPLSELETIASILGVEMGWTPKPRYAAVHLLTCMHTHEYGVTGRAFAFPDPDAALNMVDWIRENQFDYEPDRGEQFDYDIQRIIIDLNRTEVPTEQEIAEYEQTAAEQQSSAHEGA